MDNKKPGKRIFLIIACIILALMGGIIIFNRVLFNKYASLVNEYNAKISTYNDVIDDYNSKAQEATDNIKALMEEISEAQYVIDKGGNAYDESYRSTLEDEIIDAIQGVKFPILYSKKDSIQKESLFSFKKIANATTSIEERHKELLAETDIVNDAFNNLEVIDYSTQIDSITAAKTDLIHSCSIRRQITNPDKEFLVERLQKVDNVINIAASTVNNDPNNGMSAERGYTVQVYFSADYFNNAELKGDALIKEGTSAGGSLETYRSDDDAFQRNQYLAALEGNKSFNPGKHRQVGTIVLRASSELSDDKAEELLDKIESALLVPDPATYDEVVESQVILAMPTNYTPKAGIIDYVIPDEFENVCENYGGTAFVSYIGDIENVTGDNDMAVFCAINSNLSAVDNLELWETHKDEIDKVMMEGIFNSMRIQNQENRSYLGQDITLNQGSCVYKGQDASFIYATYFNPYTNELNANYIIYTYSNASNYSFPELYCSILDGASIHVKGLTSEASERFKSAEVSSDFKKMMDQYEAFFDSYIAFLEKLENSGNVVGLYADYFDMLNKYAETMEKMESIDVNSLSAADQAYYIEVTSRITEKLLKATS